jgi:hypothetical protein
MIQKATLRSRPWASIRLASTVSQSHLDVRGLFKRLELDADEPNAGVFDGEWRRGSGEILESRNPATNQVIGRVCSVSFIVGIKVNVRGNGGGISRRC